MGEFKEEREREKVGKRLVGFVRWQRCGVNVRGDFVASELGC